MKLFKFVITVLPYHLYNTNIGKIFHCIYLRKTFFKVPHKYVHICVGYFCSHCRSMSMYVGFIVKLEAAMCWNKISISGNIADIYRGNTNIHNTVFTCLYAIRVWVATVHCFNIH